VKLLIGGETFDGTARFLTERAEHERSQEKMRKKYWMYWPVFVVVRVLVATALMKDRTGSFELTLSNGLYR